MSRVVGGTNLVTCETGTDKSNVKEVQSLCSMIQSSWTHLTDS